VRRLLWFLLALLTVVMFVLILQQDDEGFAGLSRFDISSLGIKIIIVVFLGALVLAVFRERFTKALESALIWAVIAVLLAVGYTYRFELREVGDRILAELVPGHAATRGRVVEVARSANGNFAVVTQVNDARVAMVLDTGASSVVLTQAAAKAAGLPLEVLSYSVTVDTANGRTRAAPVTIDRIGVGGIVERAVPALVAQPGTLRTNLLGMSFLNRLERWEVRGDRLVLRAYP
jgi:aspartyl protease family protein